MRHPFLALQCNRYLSKHCNQPENYHYFLNTTLTNIYRYANLELRTESIDSYSIFLIISY
jgi:hypothetical protein